MVSDSGRYVVAFNGEIYNHLDLRGCAGKNWMPQPCGLRNDEAPGLPLRM